MREIDKKLTAGKSTKNTQDRKGKSFGYQILGFGSGGGGPICITYDWFVVGGGGGGVGGYGSGGGGGGVHFSYCAPGTAAVTKNTACGAISVQVGAGGAGNHAPGDNNCRAASDGGTSIAFKCEPSAITVKGGGGGNGRHRPGRAAPNPSGGSGGGGGCYHHTSATSGGAGSCYGNPGGPVPSQGAGQPPNPGFRAGSGGGACSAGANGGPAGPGAAGNGKASDIEGTTKNFGCGGIGAYVTTSCNGRGDGGSDNVATANQGGGGSQRTTCTNVGAAGVVYLRFPTACKPAAMTISPSCNTFVTAGSCTVAKFIVSGCLSFD